MIWQVLPLTSVGDGDSPYYSNSVFAGNEMLIDIDDLKERGYITERERRKALLKPVGNRIDFARTRELREELYRKAYKRFRPDADYEKFIISAGYMTMPFTQRSNVILTDAHGRNGQVTQGTGRIWKSIRLCLRKR